MPVRRGGPPRAESDLSAEVLEERRDRQRLDGREAARKKDKIGELIGASYFISDKPFPTTFRGYCLTVSRFYPEVNAAVDLFEDIGKEEKNEIDFKRGVFVKSGIRYAALSWDSDLGEIVPQLGL